MGMWKVLYLWKIKVKGNQVVVTRGFVAPSYKQITKKIERLQKNARFVEILRVEEVDSV